jgi:hypothetical protein
MELTRRDAVAALAATGDGAAGAVAFDAATGDGDTPSEGTETPERFGDHERATLAAVAAVVYPSSVTGIGPFLETYLDGRVADRPDHATGIAAAVERLDDLAETWHGGQFVDLDPETRETVLREVGADTAEPDPAGSPAERVRYYLVNEVLYGLYSSPTGGELVGIENPQGHPGGLASYRREEP